MKFLGQVLGKYLPHESSTDVEAEKVYRSPEELRQALRERGIGPAMMHLLADRMATSNARRRCGAPARPNQRPEVIPLAGYGLPNRPPHCQAPD